MKIIKKISFKRAKSLLEEYKSVQEKFSEIKSKGGKEEGVARIDSLSKLNYFIVLEYNNMADKIDYDKIFPNNILPPKSLSSDQGASNRTSHISKWLPMKMSSESGKLRREKKVDGKFFGLLQI